MQPETTPGEVSRPGLSDESLQDLTAELGRLGRALVKVTAVGEAAQQLLRQTQEVLRADEAARTREADFLALQQDLLRLADGLDASRRVGQALLRRYAEPPSTLQRLMRWLGVLPMPDSTDLRQLVEGTRLLHDRLQEILADRGVQRIPTVGLPFDPSLHRAVGGAETSSHPLGTVLSEQVAGYRVGDRILRYPEVIVARPQGGGTPLDKTSTNDTGGNGP